MKACDILEKSFGGAEKGKEATLQPHKRLYALLQMEENESMVDIFKRVTRFINLIKMCDEVMTTKLIVARILRSILLLFDHMVVDIEESKDLSSLTKEELQGTLESYE